jgi:anti-sigma-K factor RskA
VNCEEADGLIAAYALGALAAGEHERLAGHLATCERHRAEARELASVATLLALPEEQAPPPGLRGRIVAAAVAEARAAPALPLPIGAGRQRAVLPLRYRVAAIAAGVVILALAALNVGLLLRDDGDAIDAPAQVIALDRGDGAGGFVLYYDDEKRALLVADGLDPIDTDRGYQLWSIRGETAVSLDMASVTGDGAIVALVDFDAERADALAVTVEPAGGSPQPTSDPVLIARF